MKICVIGNSHISTVKMGWEAIGYKYPEVEFSFYGSIAQSLMGACIDGRRLVPLSESLRRSFRLTSGGSSEIYVDDYDFFLIVGCGFSVECIVELYSEFRSDSHVSDGRYILSDSAFGEAANGAISGKAAIHVYNQLIKLGVNGIAIVPNPLPALIISDYPNSGIWIDVEQNGDEDNLISLLDDYQKSMELAGTLVFSQPEFTKSGLMRTQDIYSVTRSDGWIDPIHKNAAFGSILIEDFLERISGQSRSSSSTPARSR